MANPFDEMDELNLYPFPQEARDILEEQNAPPRLIAHLILVHDVAVMVIEKVARQWPDLPFDADAVTFGAAIHDIGKIMHPEELRTSGRLHEQAGVMLLTFRGIEHDRARYARTHARWTEEKPYKVEDMLVALADTCWRGMRRRPLEDALVERISVITGAERWESFIHVGRIVEEISVGADARLLWQARF